MSGHGELTVERWSRFTLPQRLLQIAVEMNRAARFFDRDDAGPIIAASYERALRLADLTIAIEENASRRRELNLWRGCVATRSERQPPDREEHRLATRLLLQLHPETIAQVAYLP